jgi:hypothetical protein
MDWWHFRRSGWALVCICLIVADLKLVKLIYILNQAFRKTGIARTNVGESGNSRYSTKTSLTSMNLLYGMQAMMKVI